uniref:Shieldin complex subunit 1 C-terminal domain-containing protein n=1 Tax=Xenopus tropicalis TaxID=8364 RepID=A0A6I8QRG9_XENTR
AFPNLSALSHPEGPFLTSCKQTSFATEPQIGDALSSSDLINYESPLKSENESMTDDAQIRKTLDAFYELGNRREFHRSDKNEMLHQLSMRISETNASGSLYALRCLQLAKVIVTQGETDIFQNKAQDSVFSSPACNEIATDNKSIPGLSEDVRRYIVNYNKK